VNRVTSPESRVEDDVVVEAARRGDEAAFNALVQRHRRELHVHCYRMLGSLDDADDMVQETFLRAWRKRETFQGRSTFRAWLYRIATNACLDLLDRVPRRVLPSQLGPASGPDVMLPPEDHPWLQPYPDRLLELRAPNESEPDALVVSRETIEIAFLTAIQLLPPKQRAALILCDVLDWSAKEAASLLESSVAAVNSALQRARATVKENNPAARADRTSAITANEEERAVLQRFIDAFHRSDANAVAHLLREDARGVMPPFPMWHDGRATIVTALSRGLDPTSPSYAGHFRMLATRANTQVAAAAYLRAPGDSVYKAFGIDVLRIEEGKIVEITAFIDPDLFAAFDLPLTL
jgi:RNA polymerase sigma-70 factor, ECF subfamily